MEKQPRQYAAEFIAAGEDKAAQKAALSGCPDEWKELVRMHIKNHRSRMGVK